MQSINPATGKVIQEYSEDSLLAVNDKIIGLNTAFQQWKLTSFAQRADILLKAATILEANKQSYAKLITAEMGKLSTEAIQEIEKCALVCKYYAENAANFLAQQTIKTEAQASYVEFAPLGVILGIMPWNFPFWQVFRFIAPTLMAGNVVLLKHASNVPGCALAIAEIFATASPQLPIFKTALVNSKQIAEIIGHQLIQAVSLTGSIAAGKSVASIAGSHIKKAVLELGGSDPYIVLADANIPDAVTACCTGRLINAGQSCIAAKRLIVVADVYDEFLNALLQKFKQLKFGDVAPLASQQILDTLQTQVATSIAKGATCIIGGDRVNQAGYYYQPTILTDIPAQAPAYFEELFGPVACVFKVANEQQAIDLANSSTFGLGAAIFSEDTKRAAKIATQINAGSVFINNSVKSDPRMPFGGVKESGYGRELSSFGIHEFVNIKSVVIK